jgi:hypothetical protein
MKKRFILGLLAVVNLSLLGWLLVGARAQSAAPEENQTVLEQGENRAASATFRTNESEQGSAAITRLKKSRGVSSPPTAFALVYSPNPNQFATNLRAIHCPEDTIKDILAAEVHRWYQTQEDALRPTPADHVPFAWSARTAEPKLLERRQQASALAHEESALLHSALSCEINVPLPLYALTSSDQQLDFLTANSPNACAIREIQDEYWAAVRTLQERTKGFWLRADLAELEQLKAQRKRALAAVLPAQ